MLSLNTLNQSHFEMENITLNELSKAAHENAVIHGFWDGKPSTEQNMMLVLTEIAEAVEADRNETEPCDHRKLFENMLANGDDATEAFAIAVKNSKYDELADVCIRLFDMAGERGLDFTKMNPCRYIRTFDKFNFADNAFGLAKGLCRDTYAIERRIQFGIHYVVEWCYAMGVSIEWFIRAKMEYNTTRGRKHGKRY